MQCLFDLKILQSCVPFTFVVLLQFRNIKFHWYWKPPLKYVFMQFSEIKPLNKKKLLLALINYLSLVVIRTMKEKNQSTCLEVYFFFTV